MSRTFMMTTTKTGYINYNHPHFLDLHPGWVNGSVPRKSMCRLESSWWCIMMDCENLVDNIDSDKERLFSNHDSNM